MPSEQIEAVSAQFRRRKESRGTGPQPDLAEVRAEFAPGGRIYPVPADVTIEPVELAGVPGSWVLPAGVDAERVLLYLHGGGFSIGSINSHAELVARLARAAGVRALFPEYRLVPEHPYPAAVEDVRAVWRQLRADGVPASSVVLVGDSAGGALVMALLVALRDAGEPLPAAAVLFSPMLDMTTSGESIEERSDRDLIFTAAFVRETAAAYVGDADHREPLVSPLFAALHGLPPLLVQVGTEEVLFSDSERLVEAAVEAGVDATLEVGEELPHVYQTIADAPEAVEATDRAGAFLRHHLDQAATVG